MNSTEFFSLNSNEADSELNQLVVAALRQLVTEFFLKNAVALVITVCCKSPAMLLYYKRLVTDLLPVNNLHVQLVYLNYSRPQRVEGRRFYNLIMVDSLEAFLQLDIGSYIKLYNSNEFHYILLKQEEFLLKQDMQGIFEYCLKNQMIHCNVQTQSEENGIKMYTYYPYTAQKCGNVAPAQINTFFQESGWQHTNYYPEKLRNFYKCPLRVAVRHLPPFTYLFNSSDGELRATGFEGEIMEELASYLNFSSKYVLIEVDDRTMNFCCGIVHKLTNRLADVGIGYFRIRPIMEDKATIILPYFMSSLVSSIYINAHNLTTYEIFTYSFDRYSWILLFGTFWLIFLSAECLHRSQNRQFTPFWQEPRRLFCLFRLLSTWFGASLATEPQEPHNRVLYATTLWSTFLLRSLYSTFIYCLFRDSIHRPFPATTLDLLTQSYVGVMNVYAFKDLTRLPNDGGYAKIPLFIYDNEDEFIALPHLERLSNERLVAVTAKEYLLYYVTMNRRAGMFHIVRELIHNQHITMYVMKHSMLSRQLDLSVLQMSAAGLVDYLRERELNEHYFHSSHLLGQQFIQQHDLVAIYVIGGVLQLIALLIFLIELMSKRCTTLQLLLEYNSSN